MKATPVEDLEPIAKEILKKPWWQSSTFKFFVVVFLTLFMCIPLAFVNGLVNERKDRYEAVQKDIGEHWGQAQGLIGPVLFVPFQPDPKKPQQYAVLLPNRLNVVGKVKPQVRSRGIFQSVVYTAEVQLEATYNPQKVLSDENGEMQNLKWTHATMGVSLNDSKGLLSGTQLLVDGQPAEALQPASGFSGLQAPVNSIPLSQGKPLQLRLTIRMNGSRGLAFSPSGKQSWVSLVGMHNKPSFSGAYLPVERSTNELGFKAKWDVSHLSRRFPQLWRQDAVTLPVLNVEGVLNANEPASYSLSGPSYSPAGDSQNISSRLSASGFGVNLIEPVDAYKQTERSLKYGILFLALTFLTYFLFERLTRANIHVLQYVMVGLALSLFYLIVLSVSEITGFSVAYGIGALATVSLISYYSAGFIPRKQRFIMPTVLIGIYAYLFSLLQLEDYSLLFGTIGLFIILAVLMAVTRNLHTQSD